MKPANLPPAVTTTTVQSIPTNQIQPNPWNRTVFDPVALEELAASIKTGGIEEPLIVRPTGKKVGAAYEIASGHRRWLAASLKSNPKPEKM